MKVNKDLIYDIGMHVGQDSEYYLKKGFRVVAVEANPVLADEQRIRFENAISAGKLFLINKGIATQRGTFPFYVNDTLSEWSSFNEEIGARGGAYHEIQVEAIPLGDLLLEYGVPYYLKIDIEGYDMMALKELQNCAVRPRFVSVENGQRPFLELFRNLGYRGFKFVNQRDVPLQKVPEPAKEGLFVEHVFPHGASGLFGEEAPGRWLSFDEVGAEIDAYWNNPERDPNIHGWFDLHAMRPE